MPNPSQVVENLIYELSLPKYPINIFFVGIYTKGYISIASQFCREFIINEIADIYKDKDYSSTTKDYFLTDLKNMEIKWQKNIIDKEFTYIFVIVNGLFLIIGVIMNSLQNWEAIEM